VSLSIFYVFNDVYLFIYKSFNDVEYVVVFYILYHIE